MNRTTNDVNFHQYIDTHINTESATYADSDKWPNTPPIGLWFNYGVVDDFMREWMIRKNELRLGEISKDEYSEWKLDWLDTCDDCEKIEAKEGRE